MLFVNLIFFLAAVFALVFSFLAQKFIFPQGRFLWVKRIFGFFITFLAIFLLAKVVINCVFLGDVYKSKSNKITSYYGEAVLFISPEAINNKCKSSLSGVLSDNSAALDGKWVFQGGGVYLQCPHDEHYYEHIEIKSTGFNKQDMAEYLLAQAMKGKGYTLINKEGIFSVYEKNRFAPRLKSGVSHVFYSFYTAVDGRLVAVEVDRGSFYQHYTVYRKIDDDFEVSYFFVGDNTNMEKIAETDIKVLAYIKSITRRVR
jgi:hypothetical protein